MCTFIFLDLNLVLRHNTAKKIKRLRCPEVLFLLNWQLISFNWYLLSFIAYFGFSNPVITVFLYPNLKQTISINLDMQVFVFNINNFSSCRKPTQIGGPRLEGGFHRMWQVDGRLGIAT